MCACVCGDDEVNAAWRYQHNNRDAHRGRGTHESVGHKEADGRVLGEHLAVADVEAEVASQQAL